MNDREGKVLIMGGGIAGMALALFLKKANIQAEVFEARGLLEGIGGGLNLAPNGLNVLANINLHKAVINAGTIVKYAHFLNGKGQTLARFRYSIPEKYNYPGVNIARATLSYILLKEIRAQGIKITFNKKLTDIVKLSNGIRACFEDRTTADGTLLVGADGVSSAVRKYILPDGPTPKFTGIVASGGFVPTAKLWNQTPEWMNNLNFVYGKNGFFGFGGADKGSIMWWTNLRVNTPYSKDELIHFDESKEKQMLLERYRNYTSPVPNIIQNCENPIRINIFDIQSLPRWYEGRIMLIGDAAHAVSPNSGQGASMALEDAMLLAKLIRDDANYETAFSKFESMRKPRVERIVEEGRRRGDDKEVVDPIKSLLREIMIRIFVNLFGVKGNQWLFEYKIDWDNKN